jgi:hypothetical protein
MKVILSIFLLLQLPLLVAEIQTEHETYQEGETIIGTIQIEGLQKQLQLQDITYYEGRKKVFFETDIELHNETYHFYTQMHREGNFTLQIGPILQEQEGIIQERTLQKNFMIKNEIITEENTTGTKILQIQPGILQPKKTMTIQLENKGTLPIKIKHEEEQTLQPNEIVTIKIIPTNKLKYYTIESYKTFNIPILPQKNETITPPRPIPLGILEATNKSITVQITEGKKETTTITLTNAGNTTIQNIILQTNINNTTIKPQTIETLEAKQNITVEIEIQTKGRGRIERKIEALYTNKENKTGILQIPITLYILPQGANESDIRISPLTCEEEGGKECQDNQICNGRTTFSQDAKYCCFAECITQTTTKDEEGGNGMLIGIIILGVLAGIGYYLYKKQKKVQPQNPLANKNPYQQQNIKAKTTKR